MDLLCLHSSSTSKESEQKRSCVRHSPGGGGGSSPHAQRRSSKRCFGECWSMPRSSTSARPVKTRGNQQPLRLNFRARLFSRSCPYERLTPRRRRGAPALDSST